MTMLTEPRRYAAVLLLLPAGCPFAPPPLPPPDMAAIVTVVSEAYRTEGRARPVVFLDTDEVCDSILPPCVPPDGGVLPELKRRLETELQANVRSPSEADYSAPSEPALTPVLAETGEVGVSVSLGRFRAEDDGYWHVNVTIARSGLDGAFVEYVLEHAEDGWTISETNYDQAVP